MVEMAWLLPDSTLRSGTIVRKRHLYSFPEACIFFVGWPNVLNLAVIKLNKVDSEDDLLNLSRNVLKIAYLRPQAAARSPKFGKVHC